MIEIDEDNCGPYDNVEFPIRPPAAGTWPRINLNSNANGPASNVPPSISSAPSSSAASTGGAKHFGQHSLSRNTGPRLAPLMEVELVTDTSNDNHRGAPGTPTPFANAFNISHSPSQSSSSSSPTVSSSTSSSAASHNQVSSVTANNKAVLSNQIHGVKPSEPTAPATTTAKTTETATTKSQFVVSSSSSVTTTSATSTKSTTNVQTSKPAAMATTNDSTIYVPTKVTSSSDTMKKKNSTLKQISVDDEDFKRHDLNPGSRLALERVYNSHPDFYQLNSKILDEGSLLKQDVNEIYRKSGETLTYDQLLQGMMVDGERFLLGGCWLYFSYVQFLDVEGSKILREPYRRGRVGLTSKRALFLSTETFTDAALEPYGDPAKPSKGGFKLEVSKQSNVVFKNIPLTNFHSAEMEVITGTSAQTKITQDTFCCGCFGRQGKWVSATPMTRSINSRVLRVGVSMPPWQIRMFMDIHLDPAMSLTTARDFISQLQQFAPHIN